jgi:hypothetical protein
MAAHALFLWQQLGTAANSHSGLTKHLKQPIWGEILYTDLSAIHPAHAPQRSRDRCAVTAYVANLWEWIFSEGIQTIGPDDFDKMDKHDDIEEDDDIDIEDFLISKPKEPVGPKYYNFLHDEYGKAVYDRYTTHSTGPVVVGDVVELSRDSNSRWTKSTQKWYAFVTDRWTTPKGAERIKIIWLYWPEDVALCMSMKYPYSNEVHSSPYLTLFLRNWMLILKVILQRSL